MPLTPQEELLRVQRFSGQRGRSPVASLKPGDAQLSDGMFHNSGFLAPAKGTAKLVSVPVNGSAYELRGLATGILEIPAIDGYEAAWISSPGAQRSWGIQFLLKPLRSGDLTSASGDGQVFFSTATQIGTHPHGGADINSVRASFVISGGVFATRVRWGLTTTDVPMVTAGGVHFDPNRWIAFSIWARNGSPSATVHLEATQPTSATTWLSLNAPFESVESKGWVAHGFWIGGSLPARRPTQGIYSPCPCIVTEVELAVSTTDNSAPTSAYVAPWVRMDPSRFVSTATKIVDAWSLDDDSTHPVSRNGRLARIVGNRTQRSTAITAQQDGSIECDGTGMVTIQQGERFRESPKTRAQGGVEGHYLEMPALSFAMCIDPRRVPWRHVSVERACLMCWSSPVAGNLGVSTDPLLGFYGTQIRPSEHLRVEIERVSSTYYLRAYFGELEPESLKHPSGTAGGSTSTAWPPPLSSAGEPPGTWNKLQGNPALIYTAGNGKTGFQIVLGADGDATHPLDYSWWIFLQRKFVAQGDAGNSCSVFVRRVATNGTLDVGFGEAKDTQADGNGERHPANQSCFSAIRLNGNDLNFRPDSYVLTLGGAGGSVYGEEKNSYDGTAARHPLMYPVDDAISRCQFSDEGDCFPAKVRIASFVAFRRYLLPSDRLAIATAGAFDSNLRLQFADDYICSYNFAEAAGNTLRDGRGDDLSFAEKVGLAPIINDPAIEQPQKIGVYPRPEPTWHNEVELFLGEFSPVTGIVQRIDSGGVEEIYATAKTGIYQYNRGTHTLNRLGTLPGQGGPGQASLVLDTNDVIHVAGGAGRPVILTRDKVLAISGLEAPFYSAPTSIVFSLKQIVGGLTIDFQVNRNPNINLLVGYEVDDTAVVQFAIGYWSDALKTRSRPGPVVSARYVDTQQPTTTALQPPVVVKYRLLVSGLPPPSGPNASLITHWEVFRTDSNGSVLILEKRIPISSSPVSIMIGDVPLGTADQADVFRDIPPEGMKAVVAFGDRLIGVATPESPRAVVWSKRRDSMNWPPIYTASLNQTTSPAAGCIIRRGRAFPFSRDHFYQLIESGLDVDLTIGQVESLSLDTLADGVGGISHFAAITDHDNGIYLPGNKTVYLTEGGTYRSISLENDSAGTTGGQDFSWPDSWDLSQPDRFVSFHDERRRMVAICGPSIDDPARIDAFAIFYEEALVAADGRYTLDQPDASILRGIDVLCMGEILDPNSGKREVWFGTSFGYITKFGEYGSIGTDYDWLDVIAPKVGYVIDVPTTTQLKLEVSLGAYPSADVLRGSVLRVYRQGVLISTRHITVAAASVSWVMATLDGAHGAIAGDEWTVGAIPSNYLSGKIDDGDMLSDKRMHQVEITMNE